MKTTPRVALALALLVDCGAKTGLRVPDATVDGDMDVEDVFQRFEVCVEGRFTMVRREARMVFVIDRSGSMAQNLVAGTPPSRWTAMRTALQQTLPRFENAMQMGAFVYPRVPVNGALAQLQACDQTPGDGIDVAPARGNAASLLSAISQFPPGGATPTAAAIGRATRYLLDHSTRGLAQYLVLATDGAPNCNASLNPATCDCMLPPPTTCASAALGARNCLDDDGAIASIASARSQGVSTYVIGIDGDLEGRYVNVLDRMADAGGRARAPGGRAYYSVREPTQLQAAFEEIQRTVVRCTYVTPSRPDNPDRILVNAGSATVPRDRTRRDGWDWTDAGYGELTLFGPACDRVLAASLALEATIACGL